jgi:two-component system chemotaxis sensor kinase CheA
MTDLGDLIPEFVEESLDHLKNIEEDIMIIHQGSADKELINRIFRAIHSIKGGSSFLGLKNIEILAHKMEDIFNLVRNDELELTSEIFFGVVKAIDKLKEMLEESEESDNYCIEANLDELKTYLEKETVDKIAEKMKEDIEETAVKIDKHTFDSQRKEGKKVYLAQFEFIDESPGGKNYLDFFNEIEKAGEIIVKNVDMELVLKDDNFTGQGIPLSILYASVLEKDLVAHIFGIYEKNVIEVKPDSLVEEEVIEDALVKHEEKRKGYLPAVEAYFTKNEAGEEAVPLAKPAKGPRPAKTKKAKTADTGKTGDKKSLNPGNGD